MREEDVWRDGRRAVIFEFVPLGRQVKVMAVDADTGIEVAIVGPVTAPRADLERLALRKLENRMRAGRPAPSPDDSEDEGPGRLV
ncbi:MAG: serine hydroxymethyltransferase [Hyphomicrobiales bacterium]|nr:serine hydroxymethyltransferase [Hyphomicrobiales bacterium]